MPSHDVIQGIIDGGWVIVGIIGICLAIAVAGFIVYGIIYLLVVIGFEVIGAVKEIARGMRIVWSKRKRKSKYIPG